MTPCASSGTVLAHVPSKQCRTREFRPKQLGCQCVVDGHPTHPFQLNLGDVLTLLANKASNRSLEFSIDVFGRLILYIADKLTGSLQRS